MSTASIATLHFILGVFHFTMAFYAPTFECLNQWFVIDVFNADYYEAMHYYRIPMHLIIGFLCMYWGLMVAFHLSHGGWSHFLTGAFMTLPTIFPVEIVGILLILDKIFVFDDMVSFGPEHNTLLEKNIKSPYYQNKVEGSDNLLLNYIPVSIPIIVILSLMTYYPNIYVRIAAYILSVVIALTCLIYAITQNTYSKIQWRLNNHIDTSYVAKL
jgi:hypothetical protein